jgi:Tol biopolymer transport system component
MTDIASQNTDIWTYDLQGDSARRLTFDPSADSVPIWSPDASRLLFASNRLSFNDLYVKNSDGAQEEKSLMHDDIDKFPNDWSRDGKYILYTNHTDLWVRESAGSEEKSVPESTFRSKEWTVLAGRQMGGIRLQRNREMGNLRDLLSGTTGQVANLG